MENRSHALAAGIFVLLLSCATALAVWYFGGERETTATYVLETRRNVSGLNIQAQVRYRGIRAGRVESIEPDPADPRVILVTISVDARYRLTRATTAQLGFQGVTGLAYVGLEDDGTNRDYLPTAGAAPPHIALKPTFFDALGDRAGDILGQVVELADRLTRALDEKNARNLSRTLENAAAASEGLKEVPQLVAAMREVLSAANLKRLDGILAQAEKAAGQAAPLTADARTLIKSMTQLSQKLDRLVDKSGSEVAATLPQIDALAQQLTANSRQLSRVLDTLDENPQALLLGKTSPHPGPGEAGFVAPATTEK